MSKSNLSVAKRYEQASEAQQVLAGAVKHLIKPVVRLMLRHSMTFQSFVQIIKRAYLEVGHEPEFTVTGRSRSKSRLALITGMTRPDVAEILDNDLLDEYPPPERWNRAVGVLEAWTTDKRYLDKKGKPKELPVRGRGSFEEMVRSYGADMPAIATLDELSRVGCLVRDKRKKTVRLLCSTFIPDTEAPEMLEYFGQAANRMLNTMVHNIVEKKQSKHFQQESWSDAIDPTDLDELRVDLRRQLAADARKAARVIEGAKRGQAQENHRVAGVGFYYFEE